MIIEVPDSAQQAVRLLAVRDEDPARPWDPPGRWWPEHPEVIGVRDRRAGGAWLAADPAGSRLSVLLNRADGSSSGLPAAPNGLRSRGSLVLDAMSGREIDDPPGTAGFNLLTVAGASATLTSWEGEVLRRSVLPPGVHMIAHHDADDSRSARIERWLPEFRNLAGAGDDWRERWIELLTSTTALPIDDDRAIIRDNRSHGYPTMSLLVCTAEISGSTRELSLESATLTKPAVWAGHEFVRAI